MGKLNDDDDDDDDDDADADVADVDADDHDIYIILSSKFSRVQNNFFRIFFNN